MKNCAVLIDMENLVGGYAFKYLGGVSLRRIFAKLEENGYKKFAVKRAYADWSHPNFHSIKWEIVELGIEPVQMYGFGKGAHKNASDIQLVIDAMELLHTKPFIDTYILVTGDGGFSTLVKKISEYGKEVIGVAYKNTSNPIFQAVCDNFIYIENTLTEEDKNKIESKLAKATELEETKRVALLQHPVLKGVVQSVDRISDYDLNRIKEELVKVLGLIQKNPKGWKSLDEGMNISTIRLLLDYLFENFNYKKLGFSRYSDFLRAVLCDTPYKLVLREPSDYRVTWKTRNLAGFKDMECLKGENIHTFEGYLDLLKQGGFPPPRGMELKEAKEALSSREVLERIEEDEGEESRILRRWRSLFRKCGAMGENAPLPASLTLEEVEKMVREKIEETILHQIGSGNPQIIDQIVEYYIAGGEKEGE